MRVWFDTEFIDTGSAIHLISIGMVNEAGFEYYAEVDDCPKELACPWVKEHVFPSLTGDVKPRHWIKDDIVRFCDEAPEIWAWYGAHDWVCMTQLFGRMIDVPSDWPQFVRDMAPMTYDRKTKLPPNPGMHNALEDARWTRRLWDQVVGVRN